MSFPSTPALPQAPPPPPAPMVFGASQAPKKPPKTKGAQATLLGTGDIPTGGNLGQKTLLGA